MVKKKSGVRNASEVIPAEKVQVLKNGTLINSETGRFISGSKDTLITPERSHSLAKRRWEKKRQAVEKGIVEGTGAKNTDQAAEIISKSLTETAITPGNSRQVESARFLWDKAGWTEKEIPEIIPGVRFEMSVETARQILELTADLVEDKKLESEDENESQKEG